MKQIGESEEVFMAYSRIDYCYYMLDDLAKSGKPRSVMEMLVDRATGYDKRISGENIKTAIELLEEIIKSKKIIEADYSKDEVALQKIKELEK